MIVSFPRSTANDLTVWDLRRIQAVAGAITDLDGGKYQQLSHQPPGSVVDLVGPLKGCFMVTPTEHIRTQTPPEGGTPNIPTT